MEIRNMADNTDLGVEPDIEAEAPKAKGKAKAKAPEPAAVIPEALSAAVEEEDTVLQAHFLRQANHEKDLAPSIAKRARDEAERDERLAESDRIAAEWRKKVEAQQKEQAEREERDGAAERIVVLESEIVMHEEAIKTREAERKRLKKLLEG